MSNDWGLIPYLSVSDAEAAIAFYERAFGATVVAKMPAPTGVMMHVELDIHGAKLYFADIRVMEGGTAAGTVEPQETDGVTLHLNVPDAVAVATQAIAAGGIELMKTERQFWGDVYGRVRDPFGFTWGIMTPQHASADVVEAGIREQFSP